jgi:hypothetical protein
MNPACLHLGQNLLLHPVLPLMFLILILFPVLVRLTRLACPWRS